MEGGEPPFDWATLVSRIVHPTKVAIVEALLYIGQPLSPKQLSGVFDDPAHYLSAVAYHVKNLRDVGALEERGTRQVRGAKEHFYDFAESSSDEKAPEA